eukprot:CAMPEP_0204643066 /NCGR_PEP_ID=MMETSP0718-20130828/394_1 /ASSEMBLY_ACC=CAM_ASM_000674 /TAXON_ID=230516 /ORGANISM="Chaetoceros curvisetus" /LENGTH=573 /DNA_ID=CAMNT_0051664111 /DNA_START=79 /DNA_END=1800 /DNA_ORIENTATION=+
MNRSDHIQSLLNDPTLKPTTRRVSTRDDSTYDTVFSTKDGDALILRIHVPISGNTPRLTSAPKMTLVGFDVRHPWIDSCMKVTGFPHIATSAAFQKSGLTLAQAVNQVVQHMQLNPPRKMNEHIRRHNNAGTCTSGRQNVNNSSHSNGSAHSSRRSRRVRGPGLGKGPPGLEYRLSSTSIGTSTSNNSNMDNTDEEEDGFVWTDAGPPTHWASSPGALKGLSSTRDAAASTYTSKGDDNDEENGCVQSDGKNGSNCQVVLVRPNVVVDPIWENITMDARRSAPTDRRGGGFPFYRQDVGTKERQRRAKDIVNSQEDEINTEEKIFLLVASSLNDKSSLPGYVYRHLIGKVKSRAEERRKLKKDDDGGDTHSDGDMRAIRQDVHGIIKHITATILEVRPGFGSSPRLTEIAATAVETLVFAKIYTYVLNEIKFEIRDKEKALRLKLSTLEREAEATGINVDTHISQDALQSLNAISSYHSIAEKLRCCVELLEHVSTIGSNANMGADCLLKLVCQHLALAKVSNLNAECIFLEEFARDQQLLQGKEGYALVTMQASLGFLNASQNLVTDVFHDD